MKWVRVWEQFRWNVLVILQENLPTFLLVLPENTAMALAIQLVEKGKIISRLADAGYDVNTK